MGFAELLDTAHYSHDHFQTTEATKNVVVGMMQQLDPEHMVFEAPDVAALKRSADAHGGVFAMVRFVGDVSVGAEIYDLYCMRWASCVELVKKLLAGDLKVPGNYDPAVNRSTWPDRLDEAEWASRLRWELNLAMLASDDEASARAHLQAHYNTLLNNIRSVKPTEIAELYLQAYAEQYDRHTTYFSHEAFQEFSDRMKAIVGIGLQFKTVGSSCIVEDVMPGGPSAGKIFARDRILAVGNAAGSLTDVSALPEGAIARFTRGTAGTPVTLQVVADDAAATPEPRILTLTREAVNADVSRARAAVFDLPTSNGRSAKLGVVRIRSLYGELDGRADVTASKDLTAAARAFESAKVNGIVLDLRHNGGGYLTEAINIAGCFLRRKVIVTTRNYDGKLIVDEADAQGPTYEGALVVLVDSMTASGAEIIAGALQDYGRAVVVGDGGTRGVGTVQQVVMINQILPAMHGAPSGAAKFTVQQFFLPSGRTTQKQGIVPDIVVHGIDDPLDVHETEDEDSAPSSLPPSDGAPRPFDRGFLSNLRADSAERQKTLAEFGWLRRRQEALQHQPAPLAPDAWRSFVQSRADIRTALNAEQRQLAEGAFPFRSVLLPGQSELPRALAADDPSRLDPTDYDDFRRFDVPLREALRIAADMTPRIADSTKP